MRRWAIAMALFLSLVAPAAAQSPDRSPRPDPRPDPRSGAVTVPVANDVVPEPIGAGGRVPLPEAVLPPQADAAPSMIRLAITASALAPRTSERPQARSGGATPVFATATAPLPEPVAEVMARTIVPTPQINSVVRFGGAGSQLAAARSPRPGPRPDDLEQSVRASAARQMPSRVTQPGTRGAVCGVPGLLGDRLEAITGRVSGCGIPEPVRLREVDGVTLSQPATVNCDTARALQTWLNRSAGPAVGRRGGGLASLRVVASYSCRTRNSQSGARLSEHAVGNAIDIAGIGLANGTELTVLGGWNERRTRRILQEMHRGACGTFGTVLGPDSDRFHQDHFHFDVASYRSGPYCR